MLLLWQCSGPARQVRDTCWCIWQTIIILGFDLGGRGENKAFGKQLLEQKVDRQSCQREAVNSLFVVSNSYSKQTNNCRLYLLIFLIRGLLRCSCRGGMQWGLPSWRAVCLHLVQMLPQLQQQVQLQLCKHWCWRIPGQASPAKDLAWVHVRPNTMTNKDTRGLLQSTLSKTKPNRI